MSDERERKALLTRMESTGEPYETESALEEARVWLRNHPGDDRVDAAMQRLEERDERLRDPENAAGWIKIVFVVAVFCVFAAAITGVIYALSGRLTPSVIAGIVLAPEITWLVYAVNSKLARNRLGR